MYVPFVKAHGTGNDFIVIIDPKDQYKLSSREIKELCSRHTGIGADGLIRIIPEEKAVFRMLYYNSDGQEASFCGNGSRVAVWLAYQAGWTENRKLLFVASDGKHTAYIKENGVVGVSVNFLSQMIDYNDGVLIDTGVPHFVRVIGDFEEFKLMDVNQVALKWRHDERFKPEGVNVTFITCKGGKVYARTFERGVEAETLSCGSGAVASAIVSKKVFKLESPVIVKYPGGELVVYDNSDGVVLEGPVKVVFQGVTKI